MPKLVDSEQRRTELAEAVWRVVRREGLEGASVRGVAREAGLSMGSLRHYFATQSDLFLFAMRLVIERIERRVAALELPVDARRAAEIVLSELLPLDQERAVENEVWLAFTTRALIDPELRSLHHQSYDLLRHACRRWVVELLADGVDVSQITVDVETERLYALVDGLATHAAIRPQECPADLQKAVLSRHLDELARPVHGAAGASCPGPEEEL